MNAQTRLIVLGGIALFVLVIVGVVAYYSMGLFKGGVNLPQGASVIDLSSMLPTTPPAGSSVTPTPSSNSLVPAAGALLKTYSGSGFSLRYPSKWGVLTCSNSQNFEFDPISGTDIKGVVCDRALKPVTVLVVNGNPTCPARSVTGASGEINYRWCAPLNNNLFLDITHRVSQLGGRATSVNDYSTQIEQIIKTISTASGGS